MDIQKMADMIRLMENQRKMYSNRLITEEECLSVINQILNNSDWYSIEQINQWNSLKRDILFP